MNPFNVKCCSQEPRWVENVPGKGYLFCNECKNEVVQPLIVEISGCNHHWAYDLSRDLRVCQKCPAFEWVTV